MRRCYLCGRTNPIYRGCYVPMTKQAKRAVGTPTGKVRTVWYDACSRCVNSEECHLAIEQKIEAEFAASMGVERN